MSSERQAPKSSSMRGATDGYSARLPVAVGADKVVVLPPRRHTSRPVPRLSEMHARGSEGSGGDHRRLVSSKIDAALASLLEQMIEGLAAYGDAMGHFPYGAKDRTKAERGGGHGMTFVYYTDLEQFRFYEKSGRRPAASAGDEPMVADARLRGRSRLLAKFAGLWARLRGAAKPVAIDQTASGRNAAALRSQREHGS